MKKTLIAMAVLVATGAASAQSSVTLYGRLDLGLATTQQKLSGSTGITRNKNTDTSLFGAQNQNTTSRIGFTGTKDLGSGKSAFFNYEVGINAEGATAIGSTRLANIGVRGNFGTVRIGTFYNGLDATRSLGNAGSKNFADAFGEEASTSLLGQQSVSSITIGGLTYTNNVSDILNRNVGHLGGRSTNSLGYISPSINNFSFDLALSSNNVNNVTGSTPAKTRQNTIILGLNYATGPLTASLAYGNSRDETPDVDAVGGRNIRGSDIAVAASYEVGLGGASATPRFIYEYSRGKDTVAVNTVGQQVSQNRNYFGLGSSFAVGAWGPWVSLGYGKLLSNADSTANPGEFKLKERGFEIGTSYTLSSNTSMYAFYNNERTKSKRVNTTLGTFVDKTFAIGMVHKW